METRHHRGENVDRQHLLDLVVFEYRSLVLRRLRVTAEWRVLEWTDAAACADAPTSTRALCEQCPVRAKCLAAAIATDDHAEWRGGVNRANREDLWAELERTYREVRDLELMRLDLEQLLTPTNRQTSATPTTNEVGR
jgi:WhiB family transcriptional regulator, redox-sensing transcriptional regulator